MRHHSDVDGPSCSTPPFAIHGDATSLRLLTHGLQTKKMQHISCQTTVRTAGGRYAKKFARERRWHGYELCACLILLAVALTHAGTQPCVVTSIISYKRLRQTTLSAADPRIEVLRRI